MAVKLLAARHLKSQWDVGSDLLYRYDKFYEARELLAIGKGLDSNQEREEAFKSTRKKEVTEGLLEGEEYRNVDVLYWLFETHWMQPVRAYISSRWTVKDGGLFAQAMTKWSYLMPPRFF